jgi:transcriptional repressor NrdR
MLTVIKKDGSREPYSREKIIDGLLIATRKRPVSREKIEEIANRVENEILSEGENEVTSKKIGELVLKYLRQVDAVAYVRFASVYREFKDVEEFTRELQKLQEEEGNSY